MSLNLNEVRLHGIMERLSNDEPVDIKEEWIDEATENFRATLKKQLLDKEPRQFRVRMSNIGRPLCQLQMAKAGAVKERKPYNHIFRMMLGDATESIVVILLRAAGINITARTNKVSLNVADTVVNGEDDIQIDDKVYDIKSASDWAYKNKWSKGIDGLMQYDDFGYVSQGVGYSAAQGKELGGWIVANKSTGEVSIVEANLSKGQVRDQLKKMANVAKAIAEDRPFERCFTDQEEYFRKEKTGNRVLPTECRMCDFARTCWPDAVQKPQAMSKAKDRKLVWYTDYKGDE